MLIGSYLLLDSAPRTNSTHGIRGLTLSKDFLRSHPSISDESSQGVESAACMDGIESGRAVGFHKLMPSKVSSFGREGVAYIKAVSKSIPLPRGRAILPSRVVVLAC